MRKNDIEIFETLFDTRDTRNIRRSTLNIKHHEFNIIDNEEDVIHLSISTTLSEGSEFYQRRIIKFIRH